MKVRTRADYKDFELEVIAEMDAPDCYPQVEEFEFDFKDGVDIVNRELHNKSDNELSKIFEHLDWNMAYNEALESQKENR